MNDWTVIMAVGALAVSIMALLGRSLDKSLSIREYEAYRSAVARDVTRVEERLNVIERTRPTTGELEILSDSLNKRLDTIAEGLNKRLDTMAEGLSKRLDAIVRHRDGS